MLTKRELKTIRTLLPDNGYEVLAERFNKNKQSIQKILTEPRRYKKEVIDDALKLIEEHHNEVASQKAKIQKLK